MSQRAGRSQPAVRKVAAAFPNALAKSVHEAGHAVVAVEAGIKVSGVHMSVPSHEAPELVGAGVGGVALDWSEFSSDASLSSEQRALLVKEVYVLFAGPVAESTLKGDSAPGAARATEIDLVNLTTGAYDDIAQAAPRIARLFPRRGDGARFVRESQLRLLRWALDNKPAVVAVASALLNRGSLSEDEVATLMHDAKCGRLFGGDGMPLDLGISALLAEIGHGRDGS